METFYRFSIENNSIRWMALDLFNDDICLSGYIGCLIDCMSLINISHLLMSWLKAQLHHYHSKQGLFVTIFKFKFIKEINIPFVNLNWKIVWIPNKHLHSEKRSTILFLVYLILINSFNAPGNPIFHWCQLLYNGLTYLEASKDVAHGRVIDLNQNGTCCRLLW